MLPRHPRTSGALAVLSRTPSRAPSFSCRRREASERGASAALCANTSLFARVARGCPCPHRLPSSGGRRASAGRDLRSDRRGTCDGGSLASDDKSQREAAPSEVLRVLMQVGCSVHIFSVMARVLYSVTTILSRFSCVLTSRECANGTPDANRADNDQVAQWSPGAQPGHERVIKNMFTLNILKYTPPKGTLTAMWRRYRRRRRVIAPPSKARRERLARGQRAR